MRLAAFTKKLVTKILKQNRYWNNKLHINNQKVLYLMMQSGDEGVEQVNDQSPEEVHTKIQKI